MSKKIILCLLAILIVVNLSALGTFLYHRLKSSRQPCLPEKAGMGFETLKRELALSPEQAKSVEERRLSFHEAIDALSKRQEEVRRDLTRELMKENPDPIRLSGCVESINDLQLQAQNRVIEHLLAVKKVLTEAQRKKFFDMVLGRMASPDEKHAPGRYLRGTGKY